jgi:hypothetical protein
MAITNLAEQLRRDEDDRQYAYDDADGSTLLIGNKLEGNLTIGIGHNLSAKGLKEKFRTMILEDDIQDATDELERAYPWMMAIDEVREAVFENIVFNDGIGGLATFKEMLSAAQAENWTMAAKQLLNSQMAIEEPARCQRLALQLESGQWQ